MDTPLDTLVARRAGDGFNARELLKDDREWVVCHTCRKRHPLRNSNADQDATDFIARHPSDSGCLTMRIGPEQMEAAMKRSEKKRRLQHLSIAEYSHNASVLEAFGTVTSLDLTGIGIATSVTAGWCSAWIDNSSNLYLEILFWYSMAAVNTAPSSQKAHFLYGPGSFLSADLPSNTAGNTVTNSASTSATLTYLDITANPVGFPLLRVVPYLTQNKVIQSAGLFGVAKGHDGWCPKFVWLGMVNAAGPTITSAGSAIKYAGSFATVA